MEPTPSSSTPDADPPKPPASPEPASPAATPKPVVSDVPALDPGISQTIEPPADRPVPPPPFTPSVSTGPKPVSPAPATPNAHSVPPAPTSTGPSAAGASNAPTPGTPPSPPAGSPPTPTYQPTVMVGSDVPPTKPAFSDTPPNRRFPKKIIIPIVAAVLLIGGASAYYFGYYSNPSVIYSQSLGNTGKGYDKLVDFADKQSKLASKGYTGSGSYKFKTDGFSTDGDIGYKGNNSNDELTFDLGLAGTRINADIRTFKTSNSATPDFYFKVGGLKGLGTVAGEPDLDPYLAKLDNEWIVVDHTFYDSLTAGSSDSSNGPSSPTHDQVMDEARAFGRVNQQYLFSTDKDKAVTMVVKKYGRETVDGHKT
ncbi:MAG TPA: hypothetical protein VN554_03290, partial [Verrucomicrobiae bacterium]|nr:hypothetical protein [Verrucomicrobiae bacterium]